MSIVGPVPISIHGALAELSFLADRSPTTSAEQAKDAFSMLAVCQSGGVFVGYWAGASEWERHNAGDEIVMVAEGETTIYFLVDNDERPATLGVGDLVIVPQGVWHRFETAVGVKLMSITPQPTDHAAQRPI